MTPHHHQPRRRTAQPRTRAHPRASPPLQQPQGGRVDKVSIATPSPYYGSPNRVDNSGNSGRGGGV